jgi:hypothetical protein
MSLRSRLLPLLFALLATSALAAPSARANGDPASDYLISQPVFFPFESKVGDIAARELTQLLEVAKKAGLEVRVALIATPADLGAVPVLYRKPQRYADFLGQELVFFYKGMLLVVMPNGYGLHRPGAALTPDKAELAKLPVPGITDGDALAVGAENAVRTLARQRGITLREPVLSSSSRNRDRIKIVAGVILLAALGLVVRQVIVRRRRGEGDAS